MFSIEKFIHVNNFLSESRSQESWILFIVGFNRETWNWFYFFKTMRSFGRSRARHSRERIFAREFAITIFFIDMLLIRRWERNIRQGRQKERNKAVSKSDRIHREKLQRPSRFYGHREGDARSFRVRSLDLVSVVKIVCRCESVPGNGDGFLDKKTHACRYATAIMVIQGIR